MAVRNYGLITSTEELLEFRTRVMRSAEFDIDIETGYDGPDRANASVHPEEGFVVGFSFTDSLDWARYVPLRHFVGSEYNLNPMEVAVILWPWLRSGKAVAHGADFERRFLAKFFRDYLSDNSEFGAEVKASSGYFDVLSDSMIESYLVADQRSHALKYLAFSVFKHKMTELADLFPELPKNKKKMLRFNMLDPSDPKVYEYACDDAVQSLALHRRNYPKVKDTLLYKIEMAVLPVVCEMEDLGIKFDWEFMREKAEHAQVFVERLNSEIQVDLSKLLERDVNINLSSPMQLRSVFYEELGMTPTRFTKGSKNKEERTASTDKVSLKLLAKDQPVIEKILVWKSIKTLLNNFLLKFEREFSFAPDGMVHPSHMQAYVITGRFSTGSPNYQQLPKKYHFVLSDGFEFKMNFRDSISSPLDHYIIGFDFSQIQLRIVAGEAQEPTWLKAYEDNEDVHARTTSLMLNVPIEHVTDELRSIGKAQPVDSKILTPAGWRRFGDLEVGDSVIGSDGFPTKVSGVFPQGVREVFKVITADGATAECCAEHLWAVKNTNTKNAPWRVRELSHLLKKGLRQQTANGEYATPKYSLPARPVVQYEENSLPLNPYVLGLLLGDGGFTASRGPMFGSADRQLLDAVKAHHEELGGRWSREEEPSPKFWRAYMQAGVRWDGSTNVIMQELRALGLWGKLHHEKFVPEAYLRSSPEDRLAILQGLLDTDGNVQASGAMFRNTSKQLALDVQDLARSLGGWASITYSGIGKPSAMKNGKVITPKMPLWSVYLRMPSGVCAFKLDRKVNSCKPTVYKAPQTIFSVEPAGLKETQCVSVEAENGLYVTEGYLVTHNTLNFALLFGLSPKSLGERLGISTEEASDLFQKYFSVLSSIKVFIDKQKEFGHKHGYVVEPRFGRRMPIWEFQASERWIVEHGERACVNYPVQGGEANYVKTVMVRANKALEEAGLKDRVHLVMNIHDALEFYAHKSVTPKQIIDVLQPAIVFDVPTWPKMVAAWHIGKRWGSLKEIELMPDGKLMIKTTDEKTVELNTDADEVEEGTLPSVSPEVLRAAVVAPQQLVAGPDQHVAESANAGGLSASAEAREILIELTEMPYEDQIVRFKQFISERPGANSITLVTPQGIFPLGVQTSASPSDRHQVSLILEGATVSYAPDDVDNAAILEGVKF